MDLISQLQRDEGFRGRPYLDSEGHMTIGYGRNLDANPLTLAEGLYLLKGDIDQAERGVMVALPWVESLDAVRGAVLVNMAFNCGIAGLLTFKKMLTAIELGEYSKAAEQLLDSKYAKQVGGRAVRLAKQLETGEWQ